MKNINILLSLILGAFFVASCSQGATSTSEIASPRAKASATTRRERLKNYLLTPEGFAAYSNRAYRIYEKAKSFAPRSKWGRSALQKATERMVFLQTFSLDHFRTDAVAIDARERMASTLVKSEQGLLTVLNYYLSIPQPRVLEKGVFGRVVVSGLENYILNHPELNYSHHDLVFGPRDRVYEAYSSALAELAPKLTESQKNDVFEAVDSAYRKSLFLELE